jgi:GNAT superfamily N-acetyltransferase
MDRSHLATERIERIALEELHDAADEALRARLGLRMEVTGTALVSLAPGDPENILLNRAIGLGVEREAEPGEAARIAALYRAAGVTKFFIHLTPESLPSVQAGWKGFHLTPESLPSGLDGELEAEGLVRRRAWVKFLRNMDGPPPEARSSLDVREIGSEHAPAFARIAAHGFDMAEESEPLIAGLVRRPGWHLFMSFDGDRPAGTGALFARDGMGWCDWGATHPDFRRRGGQRAVLAARIARAAELGCRLMATTTGEAVEGDPQHSYSNIERAGFRHAYTRANYGPPPG